jgi:protein ImuB
VVAFGRRNQTHPHPARTRGAPACQGGKWFAEGETTRDYYIAEDDAGRRFWVFREGLYGVAENPLWFVHGLFS